MSKIIPVEWNPGKGGMKSDVDPKLVRGGDLFVTGPDTGAYNVRMVGKGLNVSPSYEPVVSSKYVFEPDAVTAQNKQFRLTFDFTDFIAANFTLGFQIVTPSGNVFLSTSTLIVSGAIGAMLTSIQTMFAGVGFASLTPVTSQTVVDATHGYVDVEFTTPAYYNWNFLNYTVNNLVVSDVSVLQEAIDPSMTGEWKLIGSNDLVGDSFEFWTTRNGPELELAISNVANNGSGLFRITTSTDHGFATGDIVRISGDFGNPLAVGIWAITVISATQFDLQLTTFGGAYTSGGSVFYNIGGLGEIGVAVRNYNNDVVSYTRLLRSVELNFSTAFPISVRNKRKQDNKICNYFTDKYNFPRAFYYQGTYITDGALSSVSADGLYEYGSIDTELQWIVNAEGFEIAFTQQLQSGGALKSGNWRYAARFLTAGISPSTWTLLTNPVPVYSTNNQTDGPYVIGDEENITTGKANVLTITVPQPGLFSFVEIAAVNYVGQVAQGFIIGRYDLNGSDTQQITHSGNEVGITDFDAGELNEVPPAFIKARNVELLDNRAILSNLVPASSVDFSPWVETWNYIINREALDSCGVYSTTLSALSYGEYQVPGNVYSKMTHMLYETYRYGFMFVLKKTNSVTNVFYFGEDIKIDLPTVFPARRGASASFNDYNLTNSVVDEVYTFLINFTNIDMTFQIDGVPVGELVSHIIPVRAKVIPEVLVSAVAVLGVQGTLTDGGSNLFYTSSPTGVGTSLVGPFPYISGSRFFDLGYTNLASASSATLFYPDLWPTAYRNRQFIFGPDLLYEHTAISFQSGDQIISFGTPGRANLYYNPVGGLPPVPFTYAEFDGRTDITDNTGLVIVNVEEAIMATKGQYPIPMPGVNPDSGLELVFDVGGSSPGPTTSHLVEKCLATQTTANITKTGLGNDYGLYNIIYYRALTDKYGDPSTTKYETTGVSLNVEEYAGSTIPVDILNVYGDCFTQKSYLKEMYNADNGYGMALGVSFYTQNRINAQMKHKPTPTSFDIPPVRGIFDWLNAYEPGDPARADGNLRYNEGYTPDNKIVSYPAYNDNLVYQKDWANAVAWSDIEAFGSQSDSLRKFPPLNIKFLDYSDGPITESIAMNGQLICFQPRNITRQYFNTTSAITTTDGSEVLLGEGSVMQRQGNTMTKFGCSHKHSIAVGKSEKGFDVLYYFDQINNVICRIGFDGANDMGEINGMSAFLYNYSRFVKDKDNPTYIGGISSGVNQSYREIYFTFRGVRTGISAWDSATPYNAGTVVQFTPAIFSTFEQTGEFYTALQPNTNVQPDTDSDIWELVPHNNPEYYSEFTLTFNEVKNEFQPFMAFKPVIYAKLGDGLLVPRPISNTGKMFDLNGGTTWTTWFDDGTTSQTAQSFFDAVINAPEGRKSYIAIRTDCLNRPSRIEVRTNQHFTYMDSAEFTQREGNEFDVPVMHDATNTGLNNGNTSSLYGDYAIIRFIMSAGSYNLWTKFFMKVRQRAREYLK